MRSSMFCTFFKTFFLLLQMENTSSQNQIANFPNMLQKVGAPLTATASTPTGVQPWRFTFESNSTSTAPSCCATKLRDTTTTFNCASTLHQEQPATMPPIWLDSLSRLIWATSLKARRFDPKTTYLRICGVQRLCGSSRRLTGPTGACPRTRLGRGS